MTTRGRSLQSKLLASELTPADRDVVTATSSGPPPTSRANVVRAASACSIQYSHGAPFSSQSVR